MLDQRSYNVPSGGAPRSERSHLPPETSQSQAMSKTDDVERMAASATFDDVFRLSSDESPSTAARGQSLLATKMQELRIAQSVKKEELMATAKQQDATKTLSAQQPLEPAVQGETDHEQVPKVWRRNSLKRSWGRARSKMSSALLQALRSPTDDQPAAENTDSAMEEWRLFNLKREKEESYMLGAFDSFQDSIEEAMNSKYKELRGEGRFLIDEKADASLQKQPNNSTVEDEPAGPTAEERTWLSYADKKDEVLDCPDASTEYPIYRPSKPKSRCCDTPYCTKVAKRGFANSKGKGPSQPTAPVAQMIDSEHHWMLSSTKDKLSSLSSTTSSISRESASGRDAVSSPASTMQPAEESGSPASSKSRHDPARAVATQSAQAQGKHPSYTSMDQE